MKGLFYRSEGPQQEVNISSAGDFSSHGDIENPTGHSHEQLVVVQPALSRGG